MGRSRPAPSLSTNPDREADHQQNDSYDGYGGGFCAVPFSTGMDCWGYNQVGELGNGIVGGPDAAQGYDTTQPVLAS